MPIYEYQCLKCDRVFEVTQSFSDEPIQVCEDPDCKGKVKKLFSPPAIIFKGSGFHVNDYGKGNGKPPSKKKEETKSEKPKPAKAAASTAKT